MKCIVLTDAKLLDAFQQRALKEANLPPPVVGANVQVDPELLVTRAYAPTKKHPERDEWCCMLDEHAEKCVELLRAEKVELPDVAEKLPDEWVKALAATDAPAPEDLCNIKLDTALAAKAEAK